MVEIDDKKLQDILNLMPDGKTYCTQYMSWVNPAIKIPRNIPSLEGIKKGNLVDMWAEKSGKFVIIIAKVDTESFKDDASRSKVDTESDD